MVPTFNEAENITVLIPKIREVVSQLTSDYEIIIVDAGSEDKTQENARALGVTVLVQTQPGFGAAIMEGLGAAVGEYVVTLDADLTHDPKVIADMWARRRVADVVVGSRYVAGGDPGMSFYRRFLSVCLNNFFAFVLSLPFKDTSSNFRFYRRKVLEGLDVSGRDFNVLQDILIRVYGNGWRIEEVPVRYSPRLSGESHLKLFNFAFSYSKTLFRLWKLRNSLSFADYDDRAFNSKIPLQRMWQRTRYRIVLGFIDARSSLLDVGCGSSKIIQAFSDGVGFDLQFKKLRFLKKSNRFLVNGSVFYLPFRDNSFKQLLCSEVIEHIPADGVLFSEFRRVLLERGMLVVGTPDYGRFSWCLIEWLYKKVLPMAYADEHITHYTRESLSRILVENGFRILDVKYVYGSEVIVKAELVSKHSP